MHLKIPLLNWGLKLSNSKPGCRVSALHFVVELISPMAFWHSALSYKCSFQLLIPVLTPVSLCEWKSGFEIDTQTLENDRLLICSLCVYPNIQKQRLLHSTIVSDYWIPQHDVTFAQETSNTIWHADPPHQIRHSKEESNQSQNTNLLLPSFLYLLATTWVWPVEK